MTKTIRLNTEAQMPLLGLGLYKMTAEKEAEKAIRSASVMGYRLFDTASAYKNEEDVGNGIRNCGIPRQELFVTTKIWNNAQRIGNIESAFNRSLDRLGLDYVDLYLIHWPVPGCYTDTWHVLEDIYRSGRAKAIGVSNFNEYQLDDLMSHSSIVPAVNQIEYHPLFNQDGIRKYCQQNGIAVQAYAPLARGAYLDRDVLRIISEKYHRSTAQIGLRWILQKGCAVIPKSVREDRILENSQIFDFELDEREMAAIDSLNENYRCANIPEDLLV
ncbi:MAG: aldo/keto reductase [Lachnospiraceae bacterium]|nr:aldo/keto reductase [Lachnospiraceae bacterium]